MSQHRKQLIEDAKANGFAKPDDFILHCEMLHTIRSVERALDRAFILGDPPVISQDYEVPTSKSRKKNKKTR